MKDSEKILLKLLQLSLGKEVEFEPVEESLWQEVFDLAKKHAVLGVIYSGVERLQPELWPPKKLSMWLYAQSGFIRQRNVDADYAAVRVCSILESKGFGPVVLLKGQGLGSLYPDAALRQCGDVDVWSRAPRKALVSYARVRKPSSKVFYHHVDLDPVGKMGVELHFTPTWMNSPLRNRRLQKFFRTEGTGVPVKLSGGEVKMPSDSFNRVFVLVHIYRHLFSEGVGLRQLMDYDCLLEKGFTEEERKACEAAILSLGLGKFAGAVMYALGSAFALDPSRMIVSPDAVRGEAFLQEVLKAGNFGHADASFPRSGAAKLRRSLRFLSLYPSEVLWGPVFKLWQILFIRLKYNRK